MFLLILMLNFINNLFQLSLILTFIGFLHQIQCLTTSIIIKECYDEVVSKISKVIYGNTVLGLCLQTILINFFLNNENYFYVKDNYIYYSGYIKNNFKLYNLCWSLLHLLVAILSINFIDPG